jgi:hypothetical protein
MKIIILAAAALSLAAFSASAEDQPDGTDPGDGGAAVVTSISEGDGKPYVAGAPDSLGGGLSVQHFNISEVSGPNAGECGCYNGPFYPPPPISQ